MNNTYKVNMKYQIANICWIIKKKAREFVKTSSLTAFLTLNKNEDLIFPNFSCHDKDCSER